MLLDLEAIERVMVEKHSQKLKTKGKVGTAQSEAKGNPKCKASCQHCKAHGGPFQTHNNLDCHPYDSNGKPLEAAAGKLSVSKKPYKKFEGNKGMAFMQSMFEVYTKAKLVSLRSVRNATMTPVTVCVDLLTGARRLCQ